MGAVIAALQNFWQPAIPTTPTAQPHPEQAPQHTYQGPAALQAAFERSAAGQAVADTLVSPAFSHPLQGLVLHKQPYSQGWLAGMASVMWREALLWRRNLQFLFAMLFQVGRLKQTMHA